MRLRPFAVFAVGGALLLALDQWTKALAVRALSLPAGALPSDPDAIRSRISPVAGDWLRLRLAGNKGAANSLFAGLPDAWRVPLLVGLAVVALAVVITMYRRTRRWPERLALTCIAGGAVGNLVDRVRLGFVVDFVQWRPGGWAFPTFNLADVAICFGGLGVFIVMATAARRVAPPGTPA